MTVLCPDPSPIQIVPSEGWTVVARPHAAETAPEPHDEGEALRRAYARLAEEHRARPLAPDYGGGLAGEIHPA